MPITAAYEYFRPQKLDDALLLLSSWGSEAKVLAGGTDLIVHIKDNLVSPKVLIDIKDLAELKGISFHDGVLKLGALVTFSEILESVEVKDDFLMLYEAAATVASVGIRNRATLAGNICTAVPSLDSAPCLLCYEAKVHVQSSRGMRDIDIRDWFLAPRKTALLPDEMVVSISIPKPETPSAGVYVKLGRYRGEDLAQAGLSILVSGNDKLRIAHCAVNPIPKRVSSIEQLLSGNKDYLSKLDEAKVLLEEDIHPITDIRASKEYRVHICKVMLERGLEAVHDRLQGKEVIASGLLGG